MTRLAILAKAVVMVLWIVQPLTAQADPASDVGLGPPLDSRQLELTKGRLIRFDERGARVEGELLAVDDRSMWLLSDGQARNIPFDRVGEIQVKRHGFGARKVWTWIAVGAAVAGVGLTAACSSYDGSSGCAAVLPVVALSWGLIGGLFSLDVVGSSWAEVPPVSPALARYSRFPQGLPEGYGP